MGKQQAEEIQRAFRAVGVSVRQTADGMRRLSDATSDDGWARYYRHPKVVARKVDDNRKKQKGGAGKISGAISA